MSTLRVNGPLPPEGSQWCAACVMLAKQTSHDEHMDAMRAALNDGKKGIAEFRMPGVLPELAVTVAVWGDAPQLPPIPVCWTHAAGINLKRRSFLATSDMGMPPDLVKGQG